MLAAMIALMAAMVMAESKADSDSREKSLMLGVQVIRGGKDWGKYEGGFALDLGYRKIFSSPFEIETHVGIGKMAATKLEDYESRHYAELKRFSGGATGYVTVLAKIGSFGLLPISDNISLACFGGDIGVGGMLSLHPYGNYQPVYANNNYNQELPPLRTEEYRVTPDLIVDASFVIPFSGVEMNIGYRVADNALNYGIRIPFWVN